MTDLSALIARLEAATEGSDELDVRIHKAVNPQQRVMVDSGSIRPARDAEYDVLANWPLEGWDDWKALRMHFGAPHYTTSLDAADSLGGQPSLATYQRKYSYGRPYCIASVPVFRRNVQICVEVSERADFHLALAAATAHLKARQVQP